MANTSILNLFERLWYHTTIKLDEKADRTHNHDEIYSKKSEVENKMPNVEVTTADNGKFLRVVNGEWAPSSIPNAEEATF